jgi:hypothetical protein
MDKTKTPSGNHMVNATPLGPATSFAGDQVTRRDIFAGTACLAAWSLLPAAASAQNPTSYDRSKGVPDMSSGFIKTKDGTDIFYKDWGRKDARPIVFHHGWPLSSDDWDAQMLFFFANGYRVVAHDRRGHGRSAQVDTGNDMDHYASDGRDHMSLVLSSGEQPIHETERVTPGNARPTGVGPPDTKPPLMAWLGRVQCQRQRSIRVS